MKLTFVYLPLFERTAVGVLGDEEMQAVEQQLLDNPRAGDVEAGTGRVRKLRVPLPGRGKSGSARLIYLYIGPKVEYNLTLDRDVRAVTGANYVLLRVALGGEF